MKKSKIFSFQTQSSFLWGFFVVVFLREILLGYNVLSELSKDSEWLMARLRIKHGFYTLENFYLE